MNAESDVRVLIARLLAHQSLPREDMLVRRALTDEPFRQELDTRLAACGLELLDNPYARHVTLGLRRELEQPVFGGDEAYLSNNMGLDRSAIALLVVLWALIILPKRQHQVERQHRAENTAQRQMFAEQKPLERGETVSDSINRRTLIADFGDKLGKATRIKMNLGQLARLRFIVQRKEEIFEGPLLDLVIDYNTLAGRVLDGALTDLLGERLSDVESMPEELGPDV